LKKKSANINSVYKSNLLPDSREILQSSEILNIGSHREGGIHSQTVQDEKEGYIIALDKHISPSNNLLFLKCINSICNVFINATIKLYDLITGRITPDGFIHYRPLK